MGWLDSEPKPTWVKSSFSFSNGNCVEVGIWKKASYSGGNGGGCVEAAGCPDGSVLVRDTKDNGTGPVLRFLPAEWTAFIAGVRNGEFDQP